MMWHHQRGAFINFVLNISEELFTIICHTEDHTEDHTTLHGVNNLLNPNYKFESLGLTLLSLFIQWFEHNYV